MNPASEQKLGSISTKDLHSIKKNELTLFPDQL